MTTDNTDLLTDDEALRESAMTDGPRALPGGLTLRPITALSFSWMQTHQLFADEFGGDAKKLAAFCYIHSEPKETIRTIIHNRTAFQNAVDDWIDGRFQHHAELEPYADSMNAAFAAYAASRTIAKHPSPGKPTEKN